MALIQTFRERPSAISTFGCFGDLRTSGCVLNDRAVMAVAMSCLILFVSLRAPISAVTDSALGAGLYLCRVVFYRLPIGVLSGDGLSFFTLGREYEGDGAIR